MLVCIHKIYSNRFNLSGASCLDGKASTFMGIHIYKVLLHFIVCSLSSLLVKIITFTLQKGLEKGSVYMDLYPPLFGVYFSF